MAMYILIIFAHVGPMGKENSNALATAEFHNKARCLAAGKEATSLARNTTKEIRFVCVEK